jgi:hypothetical protein
MSTHAVTAPVPNTTGSGGLSAPRTALVAGTLSAVLGIASIPIAALAHDLTVSRYLPALVAFTAFAGVGGVVAYKRPENRMGWMLLAVGAFGFVNEIASGYSVLDYRMHQGRLPLGRLAVLLGPTWAPAIVLIVAAIVLYPEVGGDIGRRLGPGCFRDRRQRCPRGANPRFSGR